MSFSEIAKNSVIIAQGVKFSHNGMNITKLVDPVKCAIFALQCYTVFAAGLAVATANPIADAMLNDL